MSVFSTVRGRAGSLYVIPDKAEGFSPESTVCEIRGFRIKAFSLIRNDNEKRPQLRPCLLIALFFELRF